MGVRVKSCLRSPGRPWAASVFWLLLGGALVLPVLLSLAHLQDPPLPLTALASAMGLLSIVVGLRALFRSAPVWWLLVLLVLALVFLRAAWFGLVQFSGAGFTQDFFIHADWQSMVIAWEEHGRLVRRVLGLLLLVALLLVLGQRLFRAPPAGFAWLLLPMGLVLVLASRQAMPEYELLSGWLEWRKPITAQVDETLLKRFQEIGLVEDRVPALSRVQAELPDRPKNLVLLYLESVGVNLAEQPQWPGLMPNFAGLLDQNAWVDYLWTSSYITIEGLTNSMCGTLFPFRQGSDSLAEGDGLANSLPCLGDVLDRAGYHQVYMGGAGMSFAGKGDFLGAHGYDELKGLEYWRSIGLNQRRGTWGLSDVDLFDQSIEQIRRLRERDQPWHLTLLTIGTHLPGYRYQECEAYLHGEDPFLQALHCTDQLLGRWIEQMRTQGLLEDTLVVITADHHVFRNPEMQALFGEDVMDRRLPLIVLGDDLPAAAHARGAGYDLAPTILDLLQIRHNARFILGRSLAAPHDRPDYFIKRYADIHQNEVFRPTNSQCSSREQAELSLPLDVCARGDLHGLLEALVHSVSETPARVSCAQTSGNSVSLPVSLDDDLEVSIGGASQSDRFTHRSRSVPTTWAGLYSFALARDGHVHSRRFLPLERMDEWQEGSQDTLAELDDWTIMIWRPGPDEHAASVDAESLFPDYPIIRVIEPGGGVLTEIAAREGPATVDLQALVCER